MRGGIIKWLKKALILLNYLNKNQANSTGEQS